MSIQRPDQTFHNTETLQQSSRLTLGAVMFLMAWLGVAGMLSIANSSGLVERTAETAAWMWRLLPLFIVVAVVVLRCVQASAGGSGAALRQLMDDELRQQSLNRASRDALIAVVAAQPMLLMALRYFGVEASATAAGSLMAASTAGLGIINLLISLLARDR